MFKIYAKAALVGKKLVNFFVLHGALCRFHQFVSRFLLNDLGALT